MTDADKTQALTILEQIAQHACEAANRVAQVWGLKVSACAMEKPPKEEAGR